MTEAKRLMDEANIPAGLQQFYIHTTQDPTKRFATKPFRQFLDTVGAEKRQRLEDMRSGARLARIRTEPACRPSSRP